MDFTKYFSTKNLMALKTMYPDMPLLSTFMVQRIKELLALKGVPFGSTQMQQVIDDGLGIWESDFSDGIPSWLDTTNIVDNGDGTASGAPSFYAPELVENGDFSATSYGAELNSGNLTPGRYYEITAHDDADFTADGAADNVVGTRFIATGTSVTLDAGDKVKEITWDDWTVSGQDADNYVLPGASGLRMISNGASYVYFRQTLTTISGAVYKIHANCTVVFGDVRFKTDATDYTDIGWSTGTNDFYFIAKDATTVLYFARYVGGSTDITYHNISVTQCSLDAENLFTDNNDFETLGAGGSDVFDGWTEVWGDGAIAVGAGHYGTNSAMLTTGTNTTRIRNSVASGIIPGQTLCLSFWAKGDGSNDGRILVYNNSDSSNIYGVTGTGITAATWARVFVVFAVPDGCTNIAIWLYAPSTNGGTAYFDDVSIRKILPGAELLGDPDGDTDGTWTKGTGGSVADGLLQWDGSQSAASEIYEAAVTANDLLAYNFSVDTRSAGSVSALIGATGPAKSAVGAYSGFGVAGTTHGGAVADADFVGSVGYVNIRKPTLSSCFTTTRLPGAKRVRTTVTTADSEWAGAVMCLDSQTSPANFVVAIIDHGNSNKVSLYSVASGAWTQKIAPTTITYGAGYTLELRRSGDVFSVWYGPDANSLSQVGTSQTITGMTGNYHGLFGTGDQSTFGNLYIEVV